MKNLRKNMKNPYFAFLPLYNFCLLSPLFYPKLHRKYICPCSGIRKRSSPSSFNSSKKYSIGQRYIIYMYI